VIKRKRWLIYIDVLQRRPSFEESAPLVPGCCGRSWAGVIEPSREMSPQVTINNHELYSSHCTLIQSTIYRLPIHCLSYPAIAPFSLETPHCEVPQLKSSITPEHGGLRAARLCDVYSLVDCDGEGRQHVALDALFCNAVSTTSPEVCSGARYRPLRSQESVTGANINCLCPSQVAR
jgi:hypothetical protein